MPSRSVFLIIWFCSILPPLPQITGYTHWIVTENGMSMTSNAIQPLSTSHYHLLQPWDLVKLLQQENYVKLLQSVNKGLDRVSNELQSQQDLQENIHKYYVDSNSACVKANKLLSELDLQSAHILTLETKGILSQSFINTKKLPNKTSSNQTSIKQPFCDNYFKSQFQFCCYEHLISIKNRSSLTGVPEIALYKLALPQHLTPTEYGHLVALELMENHDNAHKNWIYYNMAAFYWRVKGMASEAVSCLRAALATSPKKYQDIALVSLVNILQSLKLHSHDAIIFMNNAVLISPHFASHQIILGNLHADLSNFNQSLYHYHKAEMLFQPDKDKIKLQDIRDRIFAAKCSHELTLALSKQEDKLNIHLHEIDKYQSQSDHYQFARMAIESAQTPNDTQIYLNTLYLSSTLQNRDKESVPGDTTPSCSCSISDPKNNQWKSCDKSTKSILIDVLIKHKISHMPHPTSTSPSKINITKIRKNVHYKRYGSILKSPVNKLPNINKLFCQNIQCLNDYSDNELVLFLSPRNKGFQLIPVFNEAQTQNPTTKQQMKPLNQPNCPTTKQTDPKFKFINQIYLEKMRFKDSKILMQELVKVIGHRQFVLEEVGHLIWFAMKQQLTQKWILYNIASLYWRVSGDTNKAIECSKYAIKVSPPIGQDVSLVNLATIVLLQWRDSRKLIKLALEFDYSEPLTHFIASHIYLQSQHFELAQHHLNVALNHEPNFALIGYHKQFVYCVLCKRFRINEAARSRANNSNQNRKHIETLRQIYQKHKMCGPTTFCSSVDNIDYQYFINYTPHLRISVTSFISNYGMNSQPIQYELLWKLTTIDDIVNYQFNCIVFNDTTTTVGCHGDNSNMLAHSMKNGIRFIEDVNGHFSTINRIPSSPNSQIGISDAILLSLRSRVIPNPLYPDECDMVAPFNIKDEQPLYVSLDTVGINLSNLLDQYPPGFSFSFNNKPYCKPLGNSIIRKIIDKYQIPFDTNQRANTAEFQLSMNFLATFGNRYTEMGEIGQRLYTGLQNNATDWLLATVSANFWRVHGSALEAFHCLELAFEIGPPTYQKMLLINAADILYRIDQYEAGLEVARLSLVKYALSQDWLIIHFLIGNIFAHMGQLNRAIMFYQAALSLHNDFEPAISRIRSIQCQLIVQQTLQHHITTSYHDDNFIIP